MKTYAVSYVTTLIVFVCIDFIWLSVMAGVLYKPAMGDMLASQFRLSPAIIFYLIYAAGLVFLAVRPGLEAGSPWTACLYGAIVGFMAYATYDLTSHAVLKNWTVMLTVADLAWGTFLSAVAATAGYSISRYLT